MQETPISLLQRINRLRPALEAMRYCTLVLPLEQDTLDAIFAALDAARLAGYLDAGAVSVSVRLPEGQNPVAIATDQLKPQAEATRQ
jgi:hypothetical protein